MKIKNLTLRTNKFQEVKDFYSKILGLEINDETDDTFSVKIGWSILKFKQSTEPFLYHYCFLIPSNKLQEALHWMEERVDIVELESGEKAVNFEDWNAVSFYFYDGSGNISEFITHHDLGNDIDKQFDISDVLGISEMGIGTDDIKKVNSILEEKCQTRLWKGDLRRFGANGSPEGKFVLANYNEKETWFPTQIKIKPVPFEIEIENNDKLYRLEYTGRELRKRQTG
ncbi:VOC family protein [Sphingobacterium griseoflavum]|nr:glyoxalase [Sphingobacterium griseoflavum]